MISGGKNHYTMKKYRKKIPFLIGHYSAIQKNKL